ncbi:MAG: PEP-CTERM sorting domain-containing protein [Terriglobia bacterium]
MMKLKTILLAAVVSLGMMALAQAKTLPGGDPGNNNAPPVGAILDLNGTPIPGGGNGVTYQTYTVNFVANVANTAITFAFREDPAFESFEDASVVDQTTSSGNLLTNGDFSGGVYTDNGNSATPDGWAYANIYGAFAGGVVSTCSNGNPCWYDGAVQAYDAISQTISTNIGNTYQISFLLADNSGCSTDGGPPCNFSDLSTNGDTTDTGGNGIDVLAYAQSGLPAPAPEASTMALLGLALFGGLAVSTRRRIVNN